MDMREAIVTARAFTEADIAKYPSSAKVHILGLCNLLEIALSHIGDGSKAEPVGYNRNSDEVFGKDLRVYSADSGKGQEPKAVLCREIGETSWFDHVPVKPGSDRHKFLCKAPEWDTCEVYAPAPTAQDSKVRSKMEAPAMSVCVDTEEYLQLSNYAKGWNACRNAMLSAAPVPVPDKPQLETAEECFQVMESALARIKELNASLQRPSAPEGE